MYQIHVLSQNSWSLGNNSMVCVLYEEAKNIQSHELTRNSTKSTIIIQVGPFKVLHFQKVHPLKAHSAPPSPRVVSRPSSRTGGSLSFRPPAQYSQSPGAPFSKAVGAGKGHKRSVSRARKLSVGLEPLPEEEVAFRRLAHIIGLFEIWPCKHWSL